MYNPMSSGVINIICVQYNILIYDNSEYPKNNFCVFIIMKRRGMKKPSLLALGQVKTN